MNQDQLINTHNLKIEIMNSKEKSPRTLEQLVADFKASAGNFAAFNSGMNEREKHLFKGWLVQMRETPTLVA
jgi:superoxide dismutase